MRILSLICAILFPVLVAASPLNGVVVFGDSLSDNGNLYETYKHQLPVSPPYFQGRFSNGPVWIEQLVSSYYPTDPEKHLLDYAYGGAGVLEGDDDEDGFFTLHREVSAYFQTHETADPNSLYVVWIGANNYLAVPDDSEEALEQVLTGIQHQLHRLVEKGAKHILVVNLPDLGRTPVASNYDIVEQMTYLSKEHNIRLAKDMEGYKAQYPDVQWMLLDVNVVFEDIFEHPNAYKFTNINGTCYEQASLTSKPPTVLKMVRSIKAKANPDACKGYLFFDPVHPTTELHQFMADRTRAILDELGIEFN